MCVIRFPGGEKKVEKIYEEIMPKNSQNQTEKYRGCQKKCTHILRKEKNVLKLY